MAARILIVDDEPNIVIPLEFLLQQGGYDVSIARDGGQALEQMAACDPDLVLLDVMLPVLDGFEVCRKIRQNPAWSHARIVMLTVKAQDPAISKGLALGADAYITKPFSTTDLLEQVRGLLDA